MTSGTPDPDPLTSIHVARAVRGGEESIAWLVERFGPLLLAQARHRLRGMQDLISPEELVQEVWAILLPRLSDLEARDGHWTPVILRFLSTTLLRRVNHYLRRRLTSRSAGLPVEEEIPADHSGIVTRVRRAEVFDQVHEALERLTPEEREIIVLRGIEQLGNGEVARALGVPDYAITRRYQRALEALRKALPGSVFEDFDPS